ENPDHPSPYVRPHDRGIGRPGDAGGRDDPAVTWLSAAAGSSDWQRRQGRPLDNGPGRRRAAELIAEDPNAPVRGVGRRAGGSPTTVRDVRKRLIRGEEPVPARAPKAYANDSASKLPQPSCDDLRDPRSVEAQPAKQRRSPAMMLDGLVRDPSLRDNELG